MINCIRKYHLMLLITMFAFCNIINAQSYYGNNRFGKLQLLNDTTCTVNFISFMDIISTDTCFVHRQGDTLWLSTKSKTRYKVNIFEEMQSVHKPSFPVIIKTYLETTPNGKYEFIGESTAMYDSLTKSIVLNYDVFSSGVYIIVFCVFGEYYRVKCDFGTYPQPDKYITLQKDTNYFHGVVFEKFPLLQKRNSLIPLKVGNEEQCWLDNGFYFPKMKKKKTNQYYKYIKGNLIGLRDLPIGYDKSNFIFFRTNSK